MKCKVIFTIWLICCISAYAQIDKRFWFAAPDISNQHADRPIYLRIATLNQKANVKVSIPASNIILDQFVLNTNDIRSIDLSSKIDLIENGLYGLVRKSGILIESNEEITAYYEVKGISPNSGNLSNCDIYTLKGSNALGTDFLLPMQNFWAAANQVTDAWASFQVVATEDNTIVEITPTQDLSTKPKDATFTVVLNKGEVYSERASSRVTLLRPTGTVIKSTKKVAVTVTDDSMYDDIQSTYGAWDMGGDQIVPTSKVGTEYIINKINNGSFIDKIFITGIEDSTEVLINGTITLKVNRSETKYHLLDVPHSYLVASKPVYVLHIGGFDSELAAAMLPPIGCTGSKKVTIAVNSVQDSTRLSIVVEKGGESSFVLNGNPNFIKASNFKELTSKSGYMCGTIFLRSLGNISRIIVENTKSFQLGLLNQEGPGTFVYGYFSDFGTLSLQDTTNLCPQASSKLNAGFGKDTYLWYKDQTLIPKDSSTITVSTAGKYKVIATKGKCSFTDSTEVIFYNTVPALFDQDSLMFCFNNKSAVGISKSYASYLWSTGEKTAQIIPKTDGQLTLMVEDSNSCKVSDNIYYGSYPVVPLKVSFLSEEAYCSSNDCISIGLANSFKSYYLNDSLLSLADIGNLCVHKSKDHNYLIKTIDTYNCSQIDSVSYECSPYIGQIPNIISPKQRDGLNDYFFIPKLMMGYWKLEIYNRYGIKVMEDAEYDNNWDAPNLNDGIYFYELTHKTRKITYKGWVEVR